MEKAVALAEKMPHTLLSRQNLLAAVYRGDKQFDQKRNNIFSDIDNVIFNMTNYNNDSNSYTTEEIITIYKKNIALLEIMIEDGNYGFFRQHLSWRYGDIAIFYAQLQDYDSAIENLKLAAKHSIINDEEYDPEKEYTCLLFKGKKFGDVWHNITENDSMHQLEQMKNPAFDPIRQNAEFIEIEEKLKAYAKNR